MRPRTQLQRTAWLVLAVVGGGTLGLAVILGTLLRKQAAPLPSLTPAQFAAAQQRWEEHGLANYDAEISVTGRQTAVYRVEVRDGEPRLAQRNGQPLKQRRTFDTWSVPGMFETMAADVDSVEKVAAGKADASTVHLVLRAEFDPKLGYPVRYHRLEKRKQSADYEVTWRVTLTPR